MSCTSPASDDQVHLFGFIAGLVMAGIHKSKKKIQKNSAYTPRMRSLHTGSSSLSPVAVEMMKWIKSIVLPVKAHIHLAHPARMWHVLSSGLIFRVLAFVVCVVRGAALPDTLLLLAPLFSVCNLTPPVLISITAVRIWPTAASGGAINANSHSKGTKTLLRRMRLSG